MKFNEELNNEKVVERDASPFVAHDLMLHYAKTFEEGIIKQFLQISTLLSINFL